MSIPKGDRAALLERAPFFSRLTADRRDALLAQMEIALFSSGESIFARGDPGRALYVVVSGAVRLSILTEDGRELTLLHAGKGALFGEIGCFDGGPRTTDATALTEVEALVLQRRDLLSAMRQQSDLALAVIVFLGERLRSTNQRLEAVAFYSVETRLARFLLDRAQEAASETGAAKNQVLLRHDMSQTDISLLIAASRPNVNAAIALLEEKGALSRQGKDLICDIATLASLAGAAP